MTQSVFSVGDRVQHKPHLNPEFISFNNWLRHYNREIFKEFTIIEIIKSSISPGFRFKFAECGDLWWSDRRFEHSTQIVDLDQDDQDCI